MKIKISKSQWEKIGNKAGWVKKSQYDAIEPPTEDVFEGPYTLRQEIQMDQEDRQLRNIKNKQKRVNNKKIQLIEDAQKSSGTLGEYFKKLVIIEDSPEIKSIWSKLSENPEYKDIPIN